MQWSKQNKKRLGSVQEQYIALREIRNNTLCLESLPGKRSYRQVLEVSGINFALLTLDERQAIYENYQQFLASVSFPLQILARIIPLDLDAYLSPLRVSPSEKEKGMWYDLVRSHQDFLESQTEDFKLLERRFYIVIPSEDTKREMRFWEDKKKKAKAEAITWTETEQQLRLRRDVVASHMEGLGLHVHLLGDEELLRLYDDLLSPHRSTRFPIRSEGVFSGGKKLENVLAPSAIRTEVNYGVLEESSYFCSLAVRVLPHEVYAGWLQSLLMMNDVFDFVLVQSPHKQPDALKILRRKQAQSKSALVHAASIGKEAHPDVTMLAEDIPGLVESVAAGNERLHEVSLHLLVRGAHKDELDMRVARIRETMYTIGHYLPHLMHYEQERGLKMVLPGNLFLDDALTVESSSLATMFPFFSNLLYRPGYGAIMEGVTPEREPVVIDQWELANANRLILAPSGKGKSYKTKLDILRTHMVYQALRYTRLQQGGEDQLANQLIVVDPEREYRVLVEALGGQVVQLAPGSGNCLNPLDLPQRGNDQRDMGYEKEDVLASQVMRLQMLLDMMLSHHSAENLEATLSDEEKALLDAAIYETYRKKGITADPETHCLAAPLLKDVYEVLISGEVGDDISHLAQRLRRYTHGSLSGLFQAPTNVNLKNPLIVFDVKSLDAELRPVGLFIISNLVWSLAFASNIPRQLVIDELMTLYRYPSGARFVEEMFSRARKMYLGITGITQNVGGLLSRYKEAQNEHPILVNSATKILLGQEPASAQILSQLFGLSSQEERYLRTFKKGEGLMIVDGKRMHVQFLSSSLEHRLASTDPRELAKWEAERKAKDIDEQRESTQPLRSVK